MPCIHDLVENTLGSYTRRGCPQCNAALPQSPVAWMMPPGAGQVSMEEEAHAGETRDLPPPENGPRKSKSSANLNTRISKAGAAVSTRL